jgi:hypothetical protein
MYLVFIFSQTINGEIKRRSDNDYEWRRRSRMGYSPPGTATTIGEPELTLTGGGERSTAELPYINPQVRGSCPPVSRVSTPHPSSNTVRSPRELNQCLTSD